MSEARRPRVWTITIDGERLRALRRERGMSRMELAGRAGVSATTVARLECRSRSSCRGRTLARLAAVLGARPADIAPPPPHA